MKKKDTTLLSRLHAAGLNTIVQARALEILFTEPPASMTTLCERLGCSTASGTALADTFTKHGLAKRTYAKDRRLRTLEITPKAIRLFMP